MGTNNSISLQESWHPPPSSRVLLALLLLPPFLLFSPWILPILPLHSPSTTGTTKRKGVSSPTVKATSFPDAKPSKLQYSQAAWCLGTSLRVYRTAFAWSQPSTTTEGAPVAEGPPEETNAIGASKKNDRDRSTCITGKSLRVQRFRVVDSRQNVDANQSN